MLTAAAAFLMFLSAALLMYGIRLMPNPSAAYVGSGHDPAIFMWSLAWWPYAIVHGLNPFMTRVIWTPVGFNLAWATAIPGPSLLLWPITYCFGTVASFNVLMVLTPALVAQSAFLLCRYVSGRFLPALAGGYLFGFSPFMLGHNMMGQPTLTLCLSVPLCVYLVVLRMDDAIGRMKFAIALAAVLIFEFLISTEVFALMSLFGAVAMAIAFAVLPKEKRTALWKTTPLIFGSYFGLAILMAPYLYYAFAMGMPEQMHPIEKCAADFLGYLVPSPMMLVGGRTFAAFADTLTPHVWYGGKGVYTNPALLMILVLYAFFHWREPVGKLLMLSGAFVLVCSLGPQLHFLNHALIPMPWKWIMKLPTLNQPLPVRFSMFFFLAVSIIASIVLSDRQVPRILRVTLGLSAIILALPNLHYIRTTTEKVDTPAFFEVPVTLSSHVNPNDTLLILPFSIQGTSMLWQAQTDFYFRMVGGYIGTYVPPDFRKWAVVPMMLRDEPEPGFAEQLRPFLLHYNIKAIIIAPEAQAKWRGPVEALGIKAEESGDVLFYRVGF